ncbi:MAG TPA: hypothetical protein DD730_01200, partial [Desulfosporosinus sp.]|nr:hypothetical protein [Desulfosporosinus sp.]
MWYGIQFVKTVINNGSCGMSKTSLLKINNLAISFPYGKSQLQVVRGVDLEVFLGEVVGILGESGSGKTVTASSIIGLTKDEAGSID